MDINFAAANHTIELFNLTVERAGQLSKEMLLLEQEIAANHADYTTPGTIESPGDGIHPGKVMQRVLQLGKGSNEQLAIIFAGSVFIDRCVDAIKQVKFVEKVKANHPNAKIDTI